MASRPLFDSFAQDVDILYERWTLWKAIFQRPADEGGAIHPDEFEPFFRQVFDSFRTLTVLDLFRLCGDPPTQGRGRQNLTARRVVDDTLSAPEPRLDASARLDVSALIDLAEQKVREPGLQRLRDACLSHNDLDVALGAAAWPNVSYVDVSEAVRYLSNLRYRIGAVWDSACPPTPPDPVTMPAQIAASRLLSKLGV